jgi:hypothetical protein
MTRRIVLAMPWALLGLAVVLVAAAEVLGITSGTLAGGVNDVFIWAITVAFGTTGALIASRHRENPIGWLFLAAGIAAALGSLSGSYADFYLAHHHGPRLVAAAAAEYGEVSWMPFILLPATFLLALFPDGHLPSSRWRPVAWCAGVGIASAFVVEGMIAGPISDHPALSNPFGVDSPVISPLDGLSLLLVAIGTVGSAISLIVRFRRSAGQERQQLKWLTLAGTVVVLTLVGVMPAYDALGADVSNALIMLSVIGLPVAAGIAILQYRLYDIDVVINRTLVYGALTALLAGTYLLSVLLLQLALDAVTQGSGLAVAASTLGTAALFRPARARIQSVVDRSFFRRRYDAARTLAGFSSRVRDQVGLDVLADDLRSVVVETMQPAHVSLWIREGPG